MINFPNSIPSVEENKDNVKVPEGVENQVKDKNIENRDEIKDFKNEIFSQTPEQKAKQAEKIVEDPENQETLNQLSYVLKEQGKLSHDKQEAFQQEVTKIQTEIRDLYTEVKKHDGSKETLSKEESTVELVIDNADRKTQ